MEGDAVKITFTHITATLLAETADEVKVIMALERLGECGGRLIVEPFDSKGKITWTASEGTTQENAR
jgi:hypothetical protein